MTQPIKSMLVIDARVQNILRECEVKIREVTQNDSLSVLVFSKKIELKLSFDDIVEFVCDVTGERERDVMKKCRKKELVTARHLIIYYSFHYCSISKTEISRKLNQDHTTILNAIKVVDGLLQSGDRIMCNYVNELNNIINTLIKGNDRPSTTRTPDGNGGASEGCTAGLLCD